MFDNSTDNTNMPLSLLKKWLISTALTLLFFFGVTAGLMVKQDIDYAKGNEYAAEHIVDTILYSLRGSAIIAALLTVTAGQIVFWIAHLIHQNMVLKGKKANNKLFVIIVPIVSVVMAVAVFILTMPLWFKLGG